MKTTNLRIGVTPAGYDDIGAILKQMGYPFSPLSLDDLAQPNRLRSFDVVFINCAGPCRGKGATEAVALQSYVAGGGALYASDWASDFIAAAFGEYVDLGGFDGHAQTVQAAVMDAGLQATLGKIVQLRFDAGGWRTIAEAKKSQTHIALDEKPILVSFDYGLGHVVFTCFHNHKALPNQNEAALLQYLILKPLTAQASAPAKQAISLDLAREFMFTLSANQTSQWFEYPAVGGEPLTFALSWQGEAQCELEVQASDGNSQQTVGSQSPLRWSVPLAASGVYRARARGVAMAAPNTPMHLLIGPPKLDQPAQDALPMAPPLEIRVLGRTELPIAVLSHQQSPPLPIRRLDQDAQTP